MFIKLMLVGAVLVVTQTDAFACPCKYRLPGLQHVSSASPMPREHSQCLKHVDSMLAAAKRNLRSCKGKHARLLCSAYQLTLEYGTVDWGVPPIKEAEKMVTQANKDIDVANKDGIEIDKKMAFYKRELPNLVELQQDLTLLNDWQRNQGEFMLAYAQCVIKNDLLPTIEK